VTDVVRSWLVKSEPSEWSWEDQVKAGTTHWDGVRNYQAAGFLKQMKTGDLAFFYRSVTAPAIVGIVRVISEACLDPSDPKGVFVMVGFETYQTLPEPVTLSAIKSDPVLVHLPLIKQSRLSVMPIDPESWDYLCSKAKLI